MNKEIEGAVEGLKSFYGESRRFLDVCEKPDVTGTHIISQNSKKSQLHVLSGLLSWEESAIS